MVAVVVASRWSHRAAFPHRCAGLVTVPPLSTPDLPLGYPAAGLGPRRRCARRFSRSPREAESRSRRRPWPRAVAGAARWAGQQPLAVRATNWARQQQVTMDPSDRRPPGDPSAAPWSPSGSARAARATRTGGGESPRPAQSCAQGGHPRMHRLIFAPNQPVAHPTVQTVRPLGASVTNAPERLDRRLGVTLGATGLVPKIRAVRPSSWNRTAPWTRSVGDEVPPECLRRDFGGTPATSNDEVPWRFDMDVPGTPARPSYTPRPE